MYKISVPIMLSTVKRSGGLKCLLGELNRMGAKRVFLAIEEIDTDLKRARQTMSELKKACDFFKSHAFFEYFCFFDTYIIHNHTQTIAFRL